MHRFAFSIVVGFFCLGACTVCSARPPDIRLPDWYKTSFVVKYWNPGTREIRLSLDVEATLVPLKQLAAEVIWPVEFSSKSGKKSSILLPKGRSWKAEFVGLAPASFDGWVEITIAAFPEPAAMRKQIESSATYTSQVKAILLEEVRALEEPINIGLNAPLHIDGEIAISAPDLFIPSPVWPVDGRSLLLWLPKANLENPKCRKIMISWEKSISQKDCGKAIEAAVNLLDFFPASESVRLLTEHGTAISINPDLARQLLNVSIDALKGISAGPEDLSEQLRSFESRSPSFSDAFRAANLGVLFAAKGNNAKAGVAWKFALNRLPAWPMVKAWVQNIGRKKQ